MHSAYGYVAARQMGVHKRVEGGFKLPAVAAPAVREILYQDDPVGGEGQSGTEKQDEDDTSHFETPFFQ